MTITVTVTGKNLSACKPTCPVCGMPIIAQRSTRRFCSTACRVKRHRDSGARTRKEGLRPAQVRILEALARVDGVLSRAMIAQEAHVSPGWLSDFVGHVDPAKRVAREAHTGIVSLLSLGFVCERILDIDGKKERAYQINTDERRSGIPAKARGVTFRRLLLVGIRRRGNSDFRF